jgi:hypothetical protein
MGRGQTVLGRSVLKESTGSRFGRARILAGLLILGVLAANVFAAAITFTGTSSLGVGTVAITGCDSSISVVPVSDYVGDATTSPGFFVSKISIGGGTGTDNQIDAACDSHDVRGVIVGTDGSSIATISAVSIATGGQELTLDPTTLSAADIYGVVLEIAD